MRPYELRGGWTDARHATGLAGIVVDALEPYAPGLRRLVTGRQVLTPGDIETADRCHRRALASSASWRPTRC